MASFHLPEFSFIFLAVFFSCDMVASPSPSQNRESRKKYFFISYPSQYDAKILALAELYYYYDKSLETKSFFSAS